MVLVFLLLFKISDEIFEAFRASLMLSRAINCKCSKNIYSPLCKIYFIRNKFFADSKYGNFLISKLCG